MYEDFLHFLWQYRLFDEENLKTNDGYRIKVLNVGIKNSDAGPDFFNARIKYNNLEWAGNIEIHQNASDWYQHKHHLNPSYNNVILHIVWNYDTDVYNSNNEKILTIKLPLIEKTFNEYLFLYNNHKKIACNERIKQSDYPLIAYLTSLAVARLEKKSNNILFELKETNNNWEEVWYRTLAYSFGLKANSQAFSLLTKSLPLLIIQKNADNLLSIEALLFGQSGLLPKQSDIPHVQQLITEYEFLKTKYKLTPLNPSIWKFSKIYPTSFPTLRIALFAAFLHKNATRISSFLSVQNLSSLQKMFNTTTSVFWHNHYHFDKKNSSYRKIKISKSFVHLLLINGLFPFLFTYSKHRLNNELNDWILDCMEQLPPENNSIIKEWEKLGIKAENAFQSQALIHLYENYCKPRFCLRCNIGTYLLLHTKRIF